MRFILFLVISLFFQASTFAQIDSKELHQELEKMQKEMQEQFKNFNFGDLDFKMDTMIMKSFQFSEDFDSDNFIMPNDIDMNEMIKMLERSFSQIDMEGMTKEMEENLNQLDMSELEKMFEPFMNGEFFIIPSPEELEKGKKNKKKSSKRKTHSL